MATAPQRSGFAETSSSRRVLGSPLWYSVGPWPAILGWTRNLYSSIRSSRSSSVASLPTAPLRSGFAETSSSCRVLGSPPWYSVGPWPAILGWTRNLYSSIRSSRSSSVASLPTSPLRSGLPETSSSCRVLGSPPWYSVGPWPAILGWTRNLYSSIRSSRSSSVASLPLPRSTPAGVPSLSFCTPVRRSPAMWWLLVHGKFLRVDDTTYFGFVSSLTAHSRIAGGASSSPRATAGQ